MTSSNSTARSVPPDTPAATSNNVGPLGFQPAFADTRTGQVYPSRFEDGRLAPMHFMDGLPEHLITSRDASGRVLGKVPEVVDGFLRQGRFYTRGEATAFLRSQNDSC
jgi:hypothetical protein